MEFLHADKPEWSDMWFELSCYELNDGDPICYFQGLSWEYMGSTKDHHHLRHLKHPKTGEHEYIYIERRRAAAGWA